MTSMQDYFTQFINTLQNKLAGPLPGEIGQLAILSEDQKYKYKDRIKTFIHEEKLMHAKQSAVMLLLYPKNGQIYFPLIQRPTYDGVHSGQIALPGGKKDETDIDITYTALRETREEIGILEEHINVIGALSPVYIPPSNFLVHVQVGYVSKIQGFYPDEKEVEEIIELPLDLLIDLAIEEREVNKNSSWQMKAPGFIFEDHFIWGATAMMLSEFRCLLQEK